MSNNILKELEEYTAYLNSIPNMKPTYNNYTPIQHSTHIKRRRESKYENKELKLVEEGDLEYVNDQVMGYLSLLPSQINHKFNEIKADSSEKATEWLYQYCVANDYVKKSKFHKRGRY